jgi:hypothetical protein
MPLPPGLLPEESEERRPRAATLFGLVALVALSLAGYSYLSISKVREAARTEALRLEATERENFRLKAELTKPPPPPPLPPVPVAAPSPAPPSPWLPVFGADLIQERLTQGLHELRAGRFDQAERRFFRALPEGLLYLALTSLAQGDLKESFSFLSRAMIHVPNWLRKVRPRDLFGTEEAYRALGAALEARLAAEPLDGEAKLLAAWLRFHDLGDGHAKALVVEAQQRAPDSEEVRRFMEALGP